MKKKAALDTAYAIAGTTLGATLLSLLLFGGWGNGEVWQASLGYALASSIAGAIVGAIMGLGHTGRIPKQITKFLELLVVVAVIGGICYVVYVILVPAPLRWILGWLAPILIPVLAIVAIIGIIFLTFKNPLEMIQWILVFVGLKKKDGDKGKESPEEKKKRVAFLEDCAAEDEATARARRSTADGLESDFREAKRRLRDAEDQTPPVATDELKRLQRRVDSAADDFKSADRKATEAETTAKSSRRKAKEAAL